ncbi:MAG TPA: EamA family transporter, partial [Steroidobacteraceae bacterium]|nr:EamA family transporter [Steroidobacteraceae bacterium]
MRLAGRDLLLVLFITTIWGLNLIVSRIGLTEIPPFTFTALRFAALAVLLLPFLRLPRGQARPLVGAMLLSGAVPFGLMFWGLSLAENVSAVAIASQLGVPFTTLLSIWLLGEVVRWRRWTGIILSFAGVLVMGFDPQVFGYWQSLLLVIGSALAGSFGLLAVKRLSGFAPLQLQGWMGLVSVVPVTLCAWLLERDQWSLLSEVSWRGWGALAYATLLASLVAYSVFYHLVQRYPVTSVAPLTTLSP